MDKITKDNFQAVLTASGFVVSKCGVCGIPKFKVYRPGYNNKMIEIRPGQTQLGTYVIMQNNSAVASGYLYDLPNVIDKHFPPAQV